MPLLGILLHKWPESWGQSLLAEKMWGLWFVGVVVKDGLREKFYTFQLVLIIFVISWMFIFDVDEFILFSAGKYKLNWSCVHTI